MLFSTTTHTKPTTTQQENHQNTTTHTTTTTTKKSEIKERVKNQNHTKTQISSWVDQNHKERERDRFVGSSREGSGSPMKSKALVRGFVDQWVEGSGSKIDSWVRRLVHRSANSKAWSKGEDLERLVWGRWWSSVWLSLESTCCFECMWESSNENCLKWKWEQKLFYTLGPLFYGQHWKYFQFDPIFRTNQTIYFTEKHFWN